MTAMPCAGAPCRRASGRRRSRPPGRPAARARRRRSRSWLAGRQVGRGRRTPCSARRRARSRSRRPRRARAESLRLGCDGSAQRRDAQALRVRRERGRQRAQRHHADDADLERRPPSTSTDGMTFGQATGRFVAASRRFAARNGNLASAARAFSAPRASSPARAASPPGRPGRSRTRGCRPPRRCSPARCRPRRPTAPSLRFDSSVPWNMSPASMSSTGPVAGARGAQVVDIAAEQREPATPVARDDAAVQVVGADDGEGDGACGEGRQRTLRARSPDDWDRRPRGQPAAATPPQSFGGVDRDGVRAWWTSSASSTAEASIVRQGRFDIGENTARNPPEVARR